MIAGKKKTIQTNTLFETWDSVNACSIQNKRPWKPDPVKQHAPISDEIRESPFGSQPSVPYMNFNPNFIWISEFSRL